MTTYWKRQLPFLWKKHWLIISFNLDFNFFFNFAQISTRVLLYGKETATNNENETLFCRVFDTLLRIKCLFIVSNLHPCPFVRYLLWRKNTTWQGDSFNIFNAKNGLTSWIVIYLSIYACTPHARIYLSIYACTTHARIHPYIYLSICQSVVILSANMFD